MRCVSRGESIVPKPKVSDKSTGKAITIGGVIRLAAFALLVAMVVPIVIFLSLVIEPSPHQSDAAMIAHFYQHEADFNRLAEALVLEKEIAVVFPDSNRCQMSDEKPMDAAARDRCAEFVALFKELGLASAHVGGTPLHLYVSHSGLGVSGSSKGYVYTPADPWGVIVDDTEEWDGSAERQLKPIEGPWYIFFDRS